jgi:hypothetical protein
MRKHGGLQVVFVMVSSCFIHTSSGSHSASKMPPNDLVMVEVPKAIVSDLPVLQDNAKDLGVASPQNHKVPLPRSVGSGYVGNLGISCHGTKSQTGWAIWIEVPFTSRKEHTY